MKKLVLVLALVAICFSGIFAESFARDGMLIAPGEMNVTVGLNFPLGINAGVEFPIGTFDVAGIKLTYGAKALGSFSFTGPLKLFTAGGVGTLHFSWASFEFSNDIEWIKNIDTFIGLGLGYFGWIGEYAPPGSLGFVGNGGSSYFFSPNMAVTFAGGMGGSYLGILYKF